MHTPLELLLTTDGSSTLYNPALDETYHSKHGAIAESMHVFIKEGLDFYIAKHNAAAINIFEVGMGTGLNVLLTAIEARKYPHIQFYYEAIDVKPMPEAILASLNYPGQLGESRLFFEQIHLGSFEIPIALAPNFNLFKVLGDVNTHKTDTAFNLVYFDAFAPQKQPEMWDIALLQQMYKLLAPGGILVTYCAQGQFRRNLKSIGFTVERVPGPPQKFEMTRVTKPFA